MSLPRTPGTQSGLADSVLADLMDEVAQKLQAGESVNLDAYGRRHPEYAERLQSLLPAAQVLADLGASAARGEASVPLLGGSSTNELAVRAKSRMLNVRMARSWLVAKASCSSSPAVSLPASCVVRTSNPRPRRSTASCVMMWRSRYSLTKSVSRSDESGMSLLFLSDQRLDFVPAIRVITQRVEDLSLRQSESFADFLNRLAALM
jgi:hypothetical protein